MSVTALHPMYIHLDPLAAGDASTLKEIEEQRANLNNLPDVDYEVMIKIYRNKRKKEKERESYLWSIRLNNKKKKEPIHPAALTPPVPYP